MKGLLSAALAETAIIAYRDVKSLKALPLPSDFAAVAIIYGALGLFPESASGFAATVGWGLVLATFLNLWNPAMPTGAPKVVPTQLVSSTQPSTQGATP